MKFLYEYRTKDNVRHDGVVNAANRDAAFALLKSRGIRPGSMREAPGFFNKLLGKGKRWLAIGALGIAVVAALFVIQANKRALRSIRLSGDAPLPRHQIYGDPARMESFERAHYRNLMPTEADAYLAHYAQPGAEVRLGTNDAAVVQAFAELVAGGFAPELTLTDSERNCREASELKRVVMSMREEFRNYLSDGIGTPATYLRRLNARQARERQIFAMAQADLARTKDAQQWERINNSLRSIGLPTVPRPE